MKKVMSVFILLALCKWMMRKKPSTPFFLMKDTPYYDQIKGQKCGILRAVVHGKRQHVLVKKVIDKKWAQLTTGTFVKLSYLQLNVDDVNVLMANEDVLIYAKSSKQAAIVGRLTQGTIVQVDHLTADRHFARVCINGTAGYVPFAYMKY